ncbi:hypothetical protein [Cesiribacter andamanensis]|uniref:Uncharacterized protein n=1 Tax=Cesiribacter andamanensis AMV16 TaxID=1279009 RepID=M7NZB7_9BACT|nr:hypothetical protein [Cesiribacter andamanensis]EMR03694.1 hypothetical protein ADICEAN_01128 [Cesiribacter andamanensis AMV16]
MITKELLQEVPQDEIVINVSFDLRKLYLIPFAYIYLKINYPKIVKIFITQNNSNYGEILGLEKFRSRIDLSRYNVLTYIHSKGVTKPNSKPVSDWRALMRYFIMHKYDDAIKVFARGYELYGVNLFREDENPANKNMYAFRHSKYIYRGNFIILNLDKLRSKLCTVTIDRDYYSVEGLWGKLTTIDKAYNAHSSSISHYNYEYPSEKYIL